MKRTMQMRQPLRMLDLGNSVAEFDDALEKYFVETETFRALIENRIDVVAGDKGTGKTALYRILSRKYREFAQLKDVEIITAFNPTGNPVFQKLVHEDPLSEGQYRSVWKAYFLSLIGNWALNIAGVESSESFARLHELLSRTADCAYRTIHLKPFSRSSLIPFVGSSRQSPQKSR